MPSARRDHLLIQEHRCPDRPAKNIRVNVVCPGQTATDAVMNNMSKEFQDFSQRHTPIQRMGKPEEIAAAVVYFASDDAAYTTGQVMAVHGGFGLPTPVYADMIDLSADKNIKKNAEAKQKLNSCLPQRFLYTLQRQLIRLCPSPVFVGARAIPPGGFRTHLRFADVAPNAPRLIMINGGN